MFVFPDQAVNRLLFYRVRKVDTLFKVKLISLIFDYSAAAGIA